MLSAYFELGEAGAHALADRFFADAVARYPADRDRPDLFGTSRLSPHLAFGEIGPRQLLAAARQASACDGTCPDAEGATAFTRQLYWREFAYHQMHHFPRTTDEPLRAEFRAMPWADDPGGLEAWRTGMTGYPIVDAGMRELAATGWMHNRVRMIVASFLTKDLLLPWQVGARHFWEHLVDADLANNSFGWQWVAGSGADAAPYFRVFNPALQGAKFDSAGTYVRTWVPELTRMPDRWLHRPHEAPPDVHAGAGVTLATTYPAPIVDHAEVRVRALRAYDSIRTGRR
jgi:deoxyribodipyrimidine photo-lyase